MTSLRKFEWKKSHLALRNTNGDKATVAIGNPKWHVRKASHCGSKQQ